MNFTTSRLKCVNAAVRFHCRLLKKKGGGIFLRAELLKLILKKASSAVLNYRGLESTVSFYCIHFISFYFGPVGVH